MPILNARSSDKMVKAVDARPGHVYYCPYCGVRMHVSTSKNGIKFFMCYSGEVHSGKVCSVISCQRDIISDKTFDPQKLIERLLADPTQKEVPPGGEGPGPEPEPGEGPDEGGNGTPDEEALIRTIPIRTMRHIWVGGFTFTWKANTPLGRGKAEDYMYLYPWSNRLDTFREGRRIIQAKFVGMGRMRGSEKNSPLLFRAHNSKRIIRVQVTDERYDKLYSKFVELHENPDTGATEQKINDNWVLIAGDWTSVGYAGNPGGPADLCTTIYQARQIYICQ